MTQCCVIKTNRMDDVHRRSATSSWVSHDDTLRNTKDTVGLAVGGCVKEMVCGLFERREHQYTVLHLCNTKASDAENLSLRKRHE